MIPFAGPLKGHAKLTEDSHAQDLEYIAMLRRVEKVAQAASDEDLQILLMSGMLLIDEGRLVGHKEVWFSVASAIFVSIYLGVHMRSPLVAIFGMFQIIIAFPIAYFLYRLVFQVSFFSNMNLLAIYIILGVGADDLFVFYDAWRQSKSQVSPGPQSLH